MTERALEAAAAHATQFLGGLAERPVGAAAGAEELRARLGGPLPDGPTDPAEVVARLAEPGWDVEREGLIGARRSRWSLAPSGTSPSTSPCATWASAAAGCDLRRP
jgi:hypothetical protein